MKVLSSEKLRIAVPTGKVGGLEDTLSEVFGRAETFTIVDFQEEIRNVEILRNPAVSYKFGAGPIVVKTLIDAGVNMVISSELGPGASTLLEQHNVKRFTMNPGIKVADAVKSVTSSTKSE